MPAVHKNAVYKPLDIPNPFKEGQDRAYADILQDQIASKIWWRRTALTLLLTLAANLCVFFYSVKMQRTVPVLINVMPSGEAQHLGEVRQGEIQIPEAAVVFQIRKFISNLRSVSTDYYVLQANLEECYSMATSAYAPAMTRALREASPFDLVGKIRRTVEIESVINITARSYQVNWNETTVDASSNQKTARMRAVVTVRLLPVTDAVSKKNPLGIYIENLEVASL